MGSHTSTEYYWPFSMVRKNTDRSRNTIYGEQTVCDCIIHLKCLHHLSHLQSVMRILEVTDLESTTVQGIDRVKPNIQREYGAGEALQVMQPSGGNTELLPTQDDADVLASGWPWRGHVEFKNISMRYNPASNLVLKNLSVNIPAGSTLGVVGRTGKFHMNSHASQMSWSYADFFPPAGSGKSSLLLTLFRLVEIEGDGGSITIDGVDIRYLSLSRLRDSISIVPQSPTLFAGTLMHNLDASGKSTPQEAWSALQAASSELAKYFEDSDNENDLDCVITEGGGNLSIGQRQLICIARALLKRCKVLVLDEATSSIDMETDAQVQETIRREFVKKGVTVITVAHRLDTVLGYDKILVLDDGRPVELGSPNDLLNNSEGYLRRLFDADKENLQKGKKVSAVTAE